VTAKKIMLAECDFIAGPPEQFNMDKWDGYVAARNRLIGFLDKAGVSNPVTIAGDIHSSWVHDL
jgi:alkaline phosphatase D